MLLWTLKYIIIGTGTYHIINTRATYLDLPSVAFRRRVCGTTSRHYSPAT